MYLTVDKKGIISFTQNKKSFLENLLGKIYGDKPTCYLKLPIVPLIASRSLQIPETMVEPLTIVWYSSTIPREVSQHQCLESTFPLGVFRVTDWERKTLVDFILKNKDKVFFHDHYDNVYRCVDVL